MIGHFRRALVRTERGGAGGEDGQPIIEVRTFRGVGVTVKQEVQVRREDAVQTLEVVMVEAFLIDLERGIQVVMDEANAQPRCGLEWLQHAREVLQLGFAAIAVVAVDRRFAEFFPRR